MAWTSRALAVLPVIALGSPAFAEGERALSLSAGYATFSTPGVKKGSMAPPDITPEWGTSLALSYEVAFGTDFSLRADLAGAMFRGGNDPKKQSASSFAGLAAVGFTYRFDILSWVPYAFGGIGGVAAGGGPIDQHGASDEFVVQLGGGLDWLRSRDRSYGLEVRFASFAGDISVTTISLRGTTRWGFF
ncbi:MAG: outer membrane beta-barrel protein [Kofleriaceae bacterium]